MKWGRDVVVSYHQVHQRIKETLYEGTPGMGHVGRPKVDLTWPRNLGTILTGFQVFR